MGPTGENTVTCGNQEEVESERDSEAQTGLRRSTAEAEWPQAREHKVAGKGPEICSLGSSWRVGGWGRCPEAGEAGEETALCSGSR